MHGSWGNIPAYMLISIFWISQRRTQLVVWCHDVGGQANCYGSPIPSKWTKRTLFFHFHIVLHCCFGSPTLQCDDTTCSPSYTQQWKTRTSGNGHRGMRRDAHISTTVINHGVLRKLQQMSKKRNLQNSSRKYFMWLRCLQASLIPVRLASSRVLVRILITPNMSLFWLSWG